MLLPPVQVFFTSWLQSQSIFCPKVTQENKSSKVLQRTTQREILFILFCLLYFSFSQTSVSLSVHLSHPEKLFLHLEAPQLGSCFAQNEKREKGRVTEKEGG